MTRHIPTALYSPAARETSGPVEYDGSSILKVGPGLLVGLFAVVVLGAIAYEVRTLVVTWRKSKGREREGLSEHG
ncbi:uncharacterized protein DNG_08141 [Cephalotrichum gorgonifer]|uniref:Uncharacterized protein n=1 Tax=Cephalotrichum gorgonifer TaxID=2041049 RepID=A0AAE8N4N1_9PEZI|nr:uncharacterized protein DNG_08141 [Cephalotrichum gorgonifer]